MLQRMGLVVDPMRLTVQFNGYNAQDIDDNMCEGKIVVLTSVIMKNISLPLLMC